MKNTGGYYRQHDRKIDWYCPDCESPNVSTTKFINGDHVLTCKFCKTKRLVTVISRPEDGN